MPPNEEVLGGKGGTMEGVPPNEEVLGGTMEGVPPNDEVPGGKEGITEGEMLGVTSGGPTWSSASSSSALIMLTACNTDWEEELPGSKA